MQKFYKVATFNKYSGECLMKPSTNKLLTFKHFLRTLCNFKPFKVYFLYLFSYLQIYQTSLFIRLRFWLILLAGECFGFR